MKCETNTRVLRSWKDFQVYKYNRIPIDAHLARSLIIIVSANFSSRNGFCFIFTELWYIFIWRCFVLGTTVKNGLMKFRWYRCKTLFCSAFYVTSHFIHLTKLYIDTTYSVKQVCVSVLLNLNIKLFFGIKYVTQIKRYALKKQMSLCKHIFLSKISI